MTMIIMMTSIITPPTTRATMATMMSAPTPAA
jgi:hypothetical protein